MSDLSSSDNCVNSPQFKVSPIVTRSRKSSLVVKVSSSVKVPSNFLSDDSENENSPSRTSRTSHFTAKKEIKYHNRRLKTSSDSSSEREHTNGYCGQEKKLKVEITPTKDLYKPVKTFSPNAKMKKTLSKDFTAYCTPEKLCIKANRNNSPRTKLSVALEKITIGNTRRSILKKGSYNSTPKKAVTYTHLSDDENLPPKITPKRNTSKNISRKGILTPSMHNRTKTVIKGRDSLSTACSQLHVSYVPDSLPCREKEYSNIFNFLQGKLVDEIGGCMYISGVPGTGKTATVTEVIKHLQQSSSKGSSPTFSYVSINGMKLSEPRQAYVEILKQLDGKSMRWEQAQTTLENKFSRSSKKMNPTILVVDELDILCTKRQDVVYNLLDWPTKSHAQLIVITIANTMDLPERLLMSRVTSRLGLTRLTFQPYNFKQLQEIITKRLLGTNIFNPDAVQLVARKVASVSGDARRALDICRRAVEIAQQEGPETLVGMRHVTAALSAMITQPKIQAISHCSQLEKILLQSVVAEVRHRMI
ncbi:origin recognition complex subunit 1 [Agrilus planipennis]|uniref:Origin recognition complex subunit 1 n=1 Tax=Agrilus planipennis TaxID=224129 RepID=A0A7F5R865_AGRPL|nr:origin recognition complex subunit 1 [Agrilus planipennis]